MIKSADIIIVEQTFNCDLNHLWKCISQKEHLTQWFFPQIATFEAVKDFKTEFVIINEQRAFTHQWRLLEVKHLNKIVYDWSYKEYDGKGIVTFEIYKAQENVTKLKLTSEVIEDFPSSIPEFKRQSAVDGWNYLIKKSLVNHIEKR